jgi:nucleotidyltransferase/DNA polymerase involved in DNA repair
LLARLATKKAKPDGQFYLEPGITMDFIKQINVSDVPGNLK